MALGGMKENDGAAARVRFWKWVGGLLLGLTVVTMGLAWTDLPPMPTGPLVPGVDSESMGHKSKDLETLSNLGPKVGIRGAQQFGGSDFKRLKIAYAITITKDGNYLDGAAVLKHSVDMLGSAHDVDFVAIVHPQVTKTRNALQDLGVKIFEYPEPIKSSEIQGKHLRDTIDKSGCCGILELLKLRAFELVQYDRVVLLDMDALIVRSLDHLFEYPEEILFTYDHAMDSPGTAAPPAQGGFMVIRPSIKTYERLVDIVREGDFRPGTGWGGQNIGWCWGGQTIQGLISYYYNRVEPDGKRILDHCTYNAMVSTKNCQNTPIDEIYSIHYTVCQKPWACIVSDKTLCREMVAEWWKVRQNFEKAHGLPVSTTQGCRRRSEYVSLFP